MSNDRVLEASVPMMVGAVPIAESFYSACGPALRGTGATWKTWYYARRAGGENMTVKELRDKLSKLDDKANVAVYWEDGQPYQCFGIDDVSLNKGTPSRESGKAGFKFESSGSVTWAFITIMPE
jgi:hypothetical protein